MSENMKDYDKKLAFKKIDQEIQILEYLQENIKDQIKKLIILRLDVESIIKINQS